ncbi:integrin alpha-L [Hyperolius riggenbachi]|uniref:integrin alpha-L n=1 Tax=Hyperolius riggenbachi TaxID=752182 RepID=UPI0035A2C81F
MLCQRWCLLVVTLLEGLEVLLAYNVEVSPGRSFSALNSSRFFGYRVQQFNSTHGKRILVSDPGLGLIYSCGVISGTCDIISLPDKTSTSHVGMMLEAESESGRAIVCGSDDPHDCDQLQYRNGACYTIDSTLTPSQKLRPGYQDCQKDEVDLCFLFDGSSSTGERELKSIKTFLKNAIQSLKNTTMNFAIAQFSGKAQTELDFNQYQKSDDLLAAIAGIKLLDQGSKIFRGINFTLNKIFTEEAGNRPKAKKILVLLSDGDATDNNDGIIERAEAMGVKRYIIGFGNNFHTTAVQKKREEMVSKPTVNHTVFLNTFADLENLFEGLQKKILEIEGVQACGGTVGRACDASAQDSSFSRELSSAGFSAVLTEKHILLGDPGIFDWSGGILDISEPEMLVNVSLQKEHKYGYLGYSMKLLSAPEGSLLVAGSPRYQYVGLVTVFQGSPDEMTLERIQDISGEQVGSYFGADIEVSDIDQDGISDLVLIAAPHYYEPRRSGQVYVYWFNQTQRSLVPRGKLQGEMGHLHSQFGAAVSTLMDLDGDGLCEVAVGSPYEMDGRGALYIFHGEGGGLQTEYSQRLTAPPESYSFGLSIHGVMDMTQDGLADIVVGSRGRIALHRSLPLLSVDVTVRSIPLEIPLPIQETVCDIQVTIQTCVDPTIRTPQYTGPLNLSLHYEVNLDYGRSATRMSFMNQQRQMKKVLLVERVEKVCENHTIFLQDCFLEDVTPVQVFLNAFHNSNGSPWLLSPSSNLSDLIKIPFQLCGGNCEPNLTISLQTVEKLVVEDGTSFSVSLKLQNLGENAQKVMLKASYPAGLSFRKVNITKESRRTSLVCEELEKQSLSCSVSHPILRRASWADIHIMFGVISNISWPDQVVLTINITSNNEGNKTNTKNKVTANIPVLRPISVISRSLENSTKYLNYTEKEEQRIMTHGYEIENLAVSGVPAYFNVTVMSPPAEICGLTWDYCLTIWASNGSCEQLMPSKSPKECNGPSESWENKTFQCTMEPRSTVRIQMTGVLKPAHAWKEKKSENLRSAVMIRYNEEQYHSLMGITYHNTQVVTQVDLVVIPNQIPLIVGSAVGGFVLLIVICGLLYKCGFFKSYKDRMAEETDDLQQPGTNAADPQQPETTSKDLQQQMTPNGEGTKEATEKPQETSESPLLGSPPNNDHSQ